ncbi:MAG: hypothetical protein RR549_06430, partial [Oscillospiraceae bacterium]
MRKNSNFKMKVRKTARNSAGFLFFVSIFYFISIFYFNLTIPENYYSSSRTNFSFNQILPINAIVKENVVQSEKNLKVSSAVVNEYDVEIKLFGLFPVKEAKVKIVEKTSVIVGGEPFGMKLFSDGVMVTGFSSINTENGSFSPGKDANLQKGDIIISLNNKTVSNNTDV